MNEPETQTILIADDDTDIRELVAYRMKRSGYVVLEAADGQEALRLATDGRPDLAILDVMMPRLDGFEVARRLRDQESTARIPIILLTARAQDSDVARGFGAGADDYIRKPFSPQELAMRVQAILGRR